MARRELFFGGVLSLLMFLLNPAGVLADPITGCVKKNPKTFYNVQIGETPSGPCNIGDEALTWNQEGPPGADGADGLDGQVGEQGPPGPAGGGSQFILKDNNGNPFGTVITVRHDTQTYIALGDLDVRRRSVLTRVEFLNGVGATVPVGLTVNAGEVQFQHRVLYQSGDCTGDGFMAVPVAQADMGPAFTTSAVVGENGPGGERSLYIPANEAPVNRTFNSVSQFGQCNPFFIAINRSSVPAELLDADLHLTFPPNYTLEMP